MRVEKLFIIDGGNGTESQYGDNSEISSLCTGLYSKHCKSEAAPVIVSYKCTADRQLALKEHECHGDPNSLALDGSDEPAKAKTANQLEPAKEARTNAKEIIPQAQKLVKKAKNDAKRRIGMYIGMHGGDDGITINAEALAGFIAEAVPEEERKYLDYIALVCCKAVPEWKLHTLSDNGKLDGEEYQEEYAAYTRKRQYMINLLTDLATDGMKPVVAGWDDFVSVLPFVPANAASVRLKATKKDPITATGPQLSANGVPENYHGRKIVPGSKGLNTYSVVTSYYRGIHKSMFWMDDSQQIKKSLGGWSTRDFG